MNILTRKQEKVINIEPNKFTEEYFNTAISNSNPPFPPPETAWIQPVIVAVSYSHIHGADLYTDYSGIVFQSCDPIEIPTFNCYGWLSNLATHNGFVISFNHALGTNPCNWERKVVCCKPIQ